MYSQLYNPSDSFWFCWYLFLLKCCSSSHWFQLWWRVWPPFTECIKTRHIIKRSYFFFPPQDITWEENKTTLCFESCWPEFPQQHLHPQCSHSTLQCLNPHDCIYPHYAQFSMLLLFYASDLQHAQLCKQNLLPKQRISTDTKNIIRGDRWSHACPLKFCRIWISHYADAWLDEENINGNIFIFISQTNQLLVCNAVRNGKQ